MTEKTESTNQSRSNFVTNLTHQLEQSHQMPALTGNDLKNTNSRIQMLCDHLDSQARQHPSFIKAETRDWDKDWDPEKAKGDFLVYKKVINDLTKIKDGLEKQLTSEDLTEIKLALKVHETSAKVEETVKSIDKLERDIRAFEDEKFESRERRGRFGAFTNTHYTHAQNSVIFPEYREMKATKVALEAKLPKQLESVDDADQKLAAFKDAQTSKKSGRSSDYGAEFMRIKYEQVCDTIKLATGAKTLGDANTALSRAHYLLNMDHEVAESAVGALKLARSLVLMDELAVTEEAIGNADNLIKASIHDADKLGIRIQIARVNAARGAGKKPPESFVTAKDNADVMSGIKPAPDVLSIHGVLADLKESSKHALKASTDVCNAVFKNDVAVVNELLKDVDASNKTIRKDMNGKDVDAYSLDPVKNPMMALARDLEAARIAVDSAVESEEVATTVIASGNNAYKALEKALDELLGASKLVSVKLSEDRDVTQNVPNLIEYDAKFETKVSELATNALVQLGGMNARVKDMDAWADRQKAAAGVGT